jgi:hypothetical protein
MLVVIRILLFTFCITSINSQAMATSSQAVGENFEVLESTYVQIEIPTRDQPSTISILRTFDKIYNLIEEKYYSLLNWKMYHRGGELKVPNYDRKGQFGTWINNPNDNNCYNTRALVLIRDSDKRVTFEVEDNCIVSTGLWKDDYTGQAFTKREDIQIDHFVPLKNAYMSGAYRWGQQARCLYANYMGNSFHLKAVNGTENMRKSDKSPDKYIPPNKEYTCTYLKNWLSVKFLWGLRMTTAEAKAIQTALKENNCNLRNFNMSANDILNQNRFANKNIDVCDEIIDAQTPAPFAN